MKPLPARPLAALKGAGRAFGRGCLLCVGLLVAAPTAAAPPGFAALGEALSPEEIKRLDTDLAPTGRVPPGAGAASTGETLYRGRCAHCHGPEGSGVPFDALGPGEAVPATARLVGRFWPEATTLYDYIRRAMPQTAPGTLSNDEAYALTAYVLFLNGLVDKQQRVDGQTLRELVLPARERFYESRESRRLARRSGQDRAR